LEKLHRRAALLHLFAPRLAQEVEALLQQIAQLGARFTKVAYSFVHGDFNLDQLLIDKGRIGVVDFDSTCVGDPAIDVGNFMGNLHNKAVVKVNSAFRQLAAHFLSEYQACLPEHRVADRIHLFLSVALVRRALREFETQPYDYGQTGPDSLPVRLLQEAAACLSDH
jgi:aminoglycoside phosphotransferase (APT) family kinase protein